MKGTDIALWARMKSLGATSQGSGCWVRWRGTCPARPLPPPFLHCAAQLIFMLAEWAVRWKGKASDHKFRQTQSGFLRTAGRNKLWSHSMFVTFNVKFLTDLGTALYCLAPVPARRWQKMKYLFIFSLHSTFPSRYHCSLSSRVPGQPSPTSLF